MFPECSHQELNELAVGSFFYTLTAAMSSALDGKKPFKFGVYGAHDTTVGPLIGLIAGVAIVWLWCDTCAEAQSISFIS
jgi:uncharacterized membrane protein YccC